MIEGRLAFDFVEAPLEPYLDPAQASLADPHEHRLREIGRRWPIVWRGSIFSLGSVEDPDDPSPDPLALSRAERLLEAVDTRGLIETIGFRRLAGRDLGRAQSLHYSEAVADWIVARCDALQRALGLPLALQLPRSKPAAMTGDLDIFRFLERIAKRSGCEFVLDLSDIVFRTADEPRPNAAQSFALLPVAGLALNAESELNRGPLAEAIEITAPRALVVRCSENMFPLDGIAAMLQQADAALKGRAQTKKAGGVRVQASATCDREAIAALKSWQAELIDGAFAGDGEASPPAARLASQTLAWRNWRQRIEDTYKGQQIKQFLAAEAGGRI
jgi:hypothetical protein